MKQGTAVEGSLFTFVDMDTHSIYMRIAPDEAFSKPVWYMATYDGWTANFEQSVKSEAELEYAKWKAAQ